MTVRMGSEPILSIKQSVYNDTMIKFDGDIDGQGDGDGTCKQVLNFQSKLANSHTIRVGLPKMRTNKLDAPLMAPHGNNTDVCGAEFDTCFLFFFLLCGVIGSVICIVGLFGNALSLIVLQVDPEEPS